MANLTHSTSAWSGSVAQSYMSKKYTMATEGKIVDKNIELTITSNEMNVPRGTSSAAKQYTLKFPQSDTVTTQDIPDFTFTHDVNGNVVVS